MKYSPMKTIKEYWQQFDTYLKRLLFILCTICAIFFYLSDYCWIKNPFWSNYSSNIVITSFGFIIAIFVIDIIQKKRERKQWEFAEEIIKAKLFTFKLNIFAKICDFIDFDFDNVIPIENTTDTDLESAIIDHLIPYLNKELPFNTYGARRFTNDIPECYKELLSIIAKYEHIPNSQIILGKLYKLEAIFNKLITFRLPKMIPTFQFPNSDYKTKENFNSNIKPELINIINLIVELKQS